MKKVKEMTTIEKTTLEKFIDFSNGLNNSETLKAVDNGAMAILDYYLGIFKILFFICLLPFAIILWSLGDILLNSISGNEGKSRRRARHY